MNRAPVVAIQPSATDALEQAVVRGGGTVGEPASADAVVWTNPVDPGGLQELLSRSPARWVQLPFAGIESFFTAGVIDPELTWTCAKGIYGPACAEHALALMLVAARRIHEHVRAGHWVGRTLDAPEFRLAGRSAVVVGTGGIGRALVGMAAPLGLEFVGVNRSGDPLPRAARTVTVGELPAVLQDADFVVVAAALTGQTRGLFDGPMLGHMKGSAWLVNVSRGGLVDTDALVEALEQGRIGGAGLDVTDPEPLPDGHPLWSLDNCVITPHVANTWPMGLAELPGMVTRNVARFRAGEKLEGLVDPALGY